MRIKRFKSLTVALVLGLAAAVAFAASAHFIKASAARQGNNLVVSFKLAGLGNNQTITVTASARATAEYQCINKAGTNPSDPKKQQVTADVSVSGNFTSDQNSTVARLGSAEFRHELSAALWASTNCPSPA